MITLYFLLSTCSFYIYRTSELRPFKLFSQHCLNAVRQCTVMYASICYYYTRVRFSIAREQFDFDKRLICC